jgi:hypothetical protein
MTDKVEKRGDLFKINWAEGKNDSIEKNFADGEAWANRILANDGIEYNPQLGAFSSARARRNSGDIRVSKETMWAFCAIDHANMLRNELERAAANGNEQAIRCALLMMRFCRAFDAGNIMEFEDYLYTGSKVIEGGRRAGRKRSKTTKEDRELIKQEMAQVPPGGRMAAYQRLVRKLRRRLGLRTIQRIASEK